MAERALKCPQCNAPLAPSRFARSTVCPFCGTTVVFDEESVSASRFREAFQAWNSPASHGYANWSSFGTSHWATGALLARGEVADVYPAERARWPTERALLKVLRDRRDAPGFDHEWEVLAELQQSEAPGPAGLFRRVPEPVAHGEISGGAHTGSRATVWRWASGFVHTFEAVQRAYPRGIPPRPAIWIWRRILETLTFLHASGLVHGAVLPPHLLVEQGEHGVRLVGFRSAGRPGSRLREVCEGRERFYPAELLASRRLTPAADLAMSARCMAALLGGDAASGEVPTSTPALLAAEIGRASSPAREVDANAWALRERLGTLALEVFGPPAFCPLSIADEV